MLQTGEANEVKVLGEEVIEEGEVIGVVLMVVSTEPSGMLQLEKPEQNVPVEQLSFSSH